jgi:acetylornithine deacetylase/succinyl-diaminopimelate desuccinylase-like protein
VTLSAEAPSRRLDAATWGRAQDELVETVRELIRIPSINPAPADAPDGELIAARRIAEMLRTAGLEPEIVEPVPGRGSVHVRLRGDGTAGDPLLLLSHLDVVPAPVERWSHDPFAADLVDGYVYGRGAVDMKAMVAMELAVVRLLAAEAREAGLDPARDPIPGLRRDVLFTCTADEEAGGMAGAKWVAENRPDWLRAAGALNECGGVSTTIAGRRFYPIQVAEKGFAAYRIAIRGTWGHGSMPRDDNAAVLAAAVIERLAVPGPSRVTPVMARFLELAAVELPPDAAALLRRLSGDDAGRAEAAIAVACDPMYARALRALLRDTISPDVVHAGVKYNVIPGDAVVEIDCRVLPGTTEPEMRAQVVERLGPDLAAACQIELIVFGAPVEAPADGPLFDLLVGAIRDHDPDGIPLPVMAPFATDAKHTDPLGTPTYGFSPLRLDPDERFLERFHGVDERVSVDALRWGLPVLYDVVRGFCG